MVGSVSSPLMYECTLTYLKRGNPSGFTVLIGGNGQANHSATSIEIMMGLEDSWLEEPFGPFFYSIEMIDYDT